MRKIRICYEVLVFVIMSMLCFSCKEGADCDGCDYPKYVEYVESQTFYDSYTSYTGAKMLIDTREVSKYEAGHLEGAVNLPTNIDNMSDDNVQWTQNLQSLCPDKSTCLFFYGTTTFQMTKEIASRALKLGYESPRIFSKGYDALKSEWK